MVETGRGEEEVRVKECGLETQGGSVGGSAAAVQRQHQHQQDGEQQVYPPHMILGRKASTYLGIFDNSPPLVESKSAKVGKKQLAYQGQQEEQDEEQRQRQQQPQGPQKRHAQQPQGSQEQHTQQAQGKQQKQRQYSGAVNELLSFSEEQRRRRKKKKDKERDSEKLNEARFVSKMTSSSLVSAQQDLELYNRRPSTSSPSQDLVSKPISSATYFPHKVKDEQSAAAYSQHQPLLAAADTSDSDESLLVETDGVVVLDEDEDLNDKSDNVDNDEDEEDDEDDEDEYNVMSSDETQEFPLKVELQPFTDNVGGHTAIFRFSERAVCKALVNRENSWYETLELNHPDLLQFMPRYIGVLNVRQHFTSKEDFLNSISSKKSKTIDVTDSVPVPDSMETLPTPKLEPLQYTISLPNVEDTPLPEVCLDDNKHIIPDSLWYKYSHSPTSLPSEDSWPSDNACGDNSAVNSHDRPRNSVAVTPPYPTGSTLINTRLKELIIEEVFGQPSTSKSQQQQQQQQQPHHHHHHIHHHHHHHHLVANNNHHYCGRSPMHHLVHPLHSHSGNLGTESIRVQSSDCLANFQKNKQSRSSSTSSSTTMRFVHRKKRQDSHNSLVDLREMQQVISGDAVPDLFELDNSSSPMASVPNSPNSKPQQPTHESISYEEHSHTVVSKFILLEDLTRKLSKPCVLDLKMGTRQYGVDAKRSKQLSQREKCRNTTSRKLGVRICGLKIWNKDYYITRDKYFGRRVKIGWQFVRVLARFLYDGLSKRSILKQIPCLIKQLDTLCNEAVKLKSYRMYGASLLLMYDGTNPSTKRCKVKLNLIDFARCVTKNDMDTSIDTFKIPPKRPELEDRGFLRGLKSLKFYLLIIWNHLTSDHPLVYKDDELLQYLDSNEEFKTSWDWVDQFDKEDEARFNDPGDELRKKWRKYELIFDVEPRYGDEDVSD